MKSRNVSASSFGWDFQSNAAIVLMLKNIKSVVSVKVEGETEDVEITLENGNKMYCQAKSVFKPDDYSHVREKMKDGLETLNDAAACADVEKLIYITNSPNPFNDAKTMPFFYGWTSLPFNELPDTCKQAIIDMITAYSYDNIDTMQLEIHVLPFHGDGENRYKVMKEATAEFLQMVGLGDRGLSQTILETWQRCFTINSSQHDLKANLSKKQLIWPLIVSVCEARKDETFFEVFDESEIEEISIRYKDVINNSSEKFSFITKVLYDYNHFTASDPRQKTTLFLENCWKDYADEFQVSRVEPSVVEAIIKLVLYKVIMKKYTIAGIKKEVNL